MNFALVVDTLDLDKLVPPVAAPAPKPPAEGKKDESKPAQPAPAPAAPADDSIDLSALVGPSVNGTIKVGKLVVRGLRPATRRRVGEAGQGSWKSPA